MIGIDVIEIERIAEAIKKESFLKRVFSEEEIEYATKKQNLAESFAGMFCVKEAVSKVLKTGMAKGVFFSNIIVLHSENNAPYVKLIGKAKEEAERQNIKEIHISISHTNTISTAIAMGVKEW